MRHEDVFIYINIAKELVFYFSPEYRSPYYTEGCNMVILQNQSSQNPEKFQEWSKETKFQECAEICPTGQTDIAHRSDRLDVS
jgi:hypothetical protein